MYRHPLRSLLLAVLTTALLTVLPIPVSAGELDSAKLAAIRDAMQKFVDQNQISGAVTVVGTSKGIASLEAVGTSSLEPKKDMPKDALFRIASMTKPITAIGIMILADEGKLSVDDPVEKYLPEFRGQMLVSDRKSDTMTLKKPARPITLHDLLTHTSGLPNFPPGLADIYSKRDHTLAEVTLAMSQRPLDFEPGSKWSYCNSGIDTLGRVIEVVSGMPYEVFLTKRIFEPLGMKDTTPYPSKEQAARLAGLYEIKDSKLVQTGKPLIGLPPDVKHPIPAGGLCSTGADLAKLYQMMLNKGKLGDKRILSEAAVAEMTKLQTGDLACGFVPGMGFGLGWGVVKEPQGVTAMLSPGTFGHGGAFGTQGWIDPKKDLFVVLLIQRVGLQNGDASDMRRDLQTLAVGALRE
jgi:CubicO group peptidase (beta-lactamase class C family)